jgi:peroxiredoxin
MKKNKKGMLFIIFIFFVSLFFDSVVLGAESVTVIGNGAQSNSAECKNIPTFELPMPGSAGERNYLGLTGSGNFKIGQIKTQVLIIEVYSFYCPHCQIMASQVNELFNEIQKRADLKGKIKLIGIGAKNSAYEIDAFREKYKVPFPLFPDADLQITEQLCVRGTPTFIGVKVDGKGLQERFYFGEGEFKDNQKFLKEIIQASGLK